MIPPLIYLSPVANQFQIYKDKGKEVQIDINVI